MPDYLRALAFIAFIIAVVVSFVPATPERPNRLAVVPWVPIGLAFWVWSELAAPGGFDP